MILFFSYSVLLLKLHLVLQNDRPEYWDKWKTNICKFLCRYMVCGQTVNSISHKQFLFWIYLELLLKRKAPMLLLPSDVPLFNCSSQLQTSETTGIGWEPSPQNKQTGSLSVLFNKIAQVFMSTTPAVTIRYYSLSSILPFNSLLPLASSYGRSGSKQEFLFKSVKWAIKCLFSYFWRH